jgi:hypothetical protein
LKRHHFFLVDFSWDSCCSQFSPPQPLRRSGRRNASRCQCDDEYDGISLQGSVPDLRRIEPERTPVSLSRELFVWEQHATAFDPNSKDYKEIMVLCKAKRVASDAIDYTGSDCEPAINAWRARSFAGDSVQDTSTSAKKSILRSHTALGPLWGMLPPRLQLYVFSWLLSDEQTQCRMVCKQWYFLLLPLRLWEVRFFFPSSDRVQLALICRLSNFFPRRGAIARSPFRVICKKRSMNRCELSLWTGSSKFSRNTN